MEFRKKSHTLNDHLQKIILYKKFNIMSITNHLFSDRNEEVYQPTLPCRMPAGNSQINSISRKASEIIRETPSRSFELISLLQRTLKKNGKFLGLIGLVALPIILALTFQKERDTNIISLSHTNQDYRDYSKLSSKQSLDNPLFHSTLTYFTNTINAVYEELWSERTHLVTELILSMLLFDDLTSTLDMQIPLLGRLTPLTNTLNSISNHLSAGLDKISSVTIFPYLPEIPDCLPSINAPFFLSRWKNLQVLNLLSLLSSPSHWVTYLKILAIADSYLPWLSADYIPIKINYLLIGRLALDSLLLTSQTFYYGYALQKSGKYFAANQFIAIKSVPNAFMGLAGLSGMMSTLHHVNDLYRGAHLFSFLDETQQKAVLQYRAVYHLPKKKQCNAVLIDSFFTSAPFGELLYEKCNTRVYHVSSLSSLWESFDRAKEDFGAPIDKLIFFGHAHRTSMNLHNNFSFNPKNSDYTLVCIHKSVHDEGEIFLLGCNTASADPSSNTLSMTEILAENLPDRKVTGIQSYLNPFVTVQEFSKGNLIIKSYYPLNSNREFMLKNNAVSFQNGKKLEN